MTLWQKRKLPRSGVFYVRGGYGNIRNWKPVDPNPKLADVYAGNDDHPGYSDTQISEGLLAEEINAIAASPYWSESAIIITYDESDGFYDHTQPRMRSHDQNGLPLEQGPRIPAIVISPYSVAHGVSHVPSEHSSIIKFVDELFSLVPLADLPDELRARQIGADKFGQPDLGPADDMVPDVGDMSSAFDTLRLEGKAGAAERGVCGDSGGGGNAAFRTRAERDASNWRSSRRTGRCRIRCRRTSTRGRIRRRGFPRAGTGRLEKAADLTSDQSFSKSASQHPLCGVSGSAWGARRSWTALR